MTTSKKLRDMKLPPGYNACLLLDAAAEIDRLRAAIDMQPAPPTREDIEWAGKVFLAEAEEKIDRLTRERDEARAELERERLRLAACGVVAMSNTPESAARNREMHVEYRSASCDDVARAVDREMALRAERDALAKLLLRAGDALVCSGDLMSDGDEWQESHACGRCDERVDRNWVIRTEIRAALAQIEQERGEQAKDRT